MTRPRLLCDVDAATACVAAYGAPRLTRAGYELLDDARVPAEPSAALRAAASRALAGDARENPLNDDDPWWRQVAIPQRWLVQPPDPDVPMARQLGVWRLLGCQRELAEMHRALQPLVEEYAGGPVVATACYGPRLYEPGSVLLMHLDRYPTHELGVSFVCHGPPWGMWFADASLAATGIAGETLSPRQHVIYEGCRMLHGRPDPCPENTVAAFFHYHRADASTGDPGGSGHD